MLNNKTPSFGANQRGLAQHQDETVLVCLILLNKKEKKNSTNRFENGAFGRKKGEREREMRILCFLYQV